MNSDYFFEDDEPVRKIMDAFLRGYQEGRGVVTKRPRPTVEFDDEAHSLYVTVRQTPEGQTVMTEEVVLNEVFVDRLPDGRVAGIEILY